VTEEEIVKAVAFVECGFRHRLPPKPSDERPCDMCVKRVAEKIKDEQGITAELIESIAIHRLAYRGDYFIDQKLTPLQITEAYDLLFEIIPTIKDLLNRGL
jgi:hypothetical protein